MAEEIEESNSLPDAPVDPRLELLADDVKTRLAALGKDGMELDLTAVLLASVIQVLTPAQKTQLAGAYRGNLLKAVVRHEKIVTHVTQVGDIEIPSKQDNPSTEEVEQ